MQLDLTHKQVNDSRRLGKHLASGMVPVNDLRDFFQELNEKINENETGKPRLRSQLKANRKDHYKKQLVA